MRYGHEGGFTTVPSLLVVHAGDLGLSPVEQAVVIQLLFHKRSPDHPYPSAKRMARHIGRDVKSVRRALAVMEKRGLIQKVARFDENGQSSNAYNFEQLLRRLESIAEAKRPEDLDEDLDEPEESSSAGISATELRAGVRDRLFQEDRFESHMGAIIADWSEEHILDQLQAALKESGSDLSRRAMRDVGINRLFVELTEPAPPIA